MLWTVAHQAALPMGYSRQEYWSGLPFPPPGIMPTQWSNPHVYVSCIGRQVLLVNRKSYKLEDIWILIYILYIHILNFILVHVFGGRGLEMWTNECESFNFKKSNNSIVHLCKVFIIDAAYRTLFTGSHIILDFMVSLL